MESGDSHKLKLSSSEDCKSDTGTLESVNDAIITDDISEVDDTQESSSKGENSCILPADMDDAVFHNENLPVLDGFLSKKPSFEDDEEQIIENTELPKSSLVNTRALPKDATTYELESFEKHALVIFNQMKIEGRNPRHGTEKDVEALTRTFEKFGFEVTSHSDLTKGEIFGKLKKFSKRNFTEYGCVAVAILTHGSDFGMLQAADLPYSEFDVINQFKVGDVKKATLVSKPKIFIIQACRGSKISSGVPVEQSPKIRKDNAKGLQTYILPSESDLLILHSSYPGCASHRDVKNGTWFIQTLCKKIETLSSTQDLESIITEVKRGVAIDLNHEVYNRGTCKMQVNKQMPVTTSTLIRKLYLKRFGERASEDTYNVDKSTRRSESRRRYHSDSGHDVVDVVSSSPTTPLVIQLEPCSCFLEHFTLMRNCLRYFSAENPNDETAQYILAVADTFKNTDDFNSSKKNLCKLMSKHIMDMINSVNAH